RVAIALNESLKKPIHEADLIGIVSSGTSSIRVQMTYDKRRLEESIKKMTGGELKPEDIINANSLSEVRYRVSTAFGVVHELLQNLENVHDRRKALIYVSD